MNQDSTLVAGAAVTSHTVWVRRAVAVAALAAATAIGARLSVPLPGTPVPFTLQPVAVLLSGLLLGGVLGATSQLTYLAMGAAGLPVFALGGGLAYLGGPTGGYLLAFPLAAGLVGAIAGARPGVFSGRTGECGGFACRAYQWRSLAVSPAVVWWWIYGGFRTFVRPVSSRRPAEGRARGRRRSWYGPSRAAFSQLSDHGG